MFSIKLINCVDISDKKHLYMEGSVQCYTTWQYVVMIGVAIWVVPFSFSLHWSYVMLRKCQMTPNQFLFVITVPPVVIWYFIKSMRRRGRISLEKSDAMLAKHLLKVVSEPFRDSTEDGVHLQWESVLIFRKLVLAAVSAFVYYPIEKLYPLGFLLALFMTQHVLTQPYRKRVLNHLESISLVCLCFLALLNNFWAFTDEVQVRRSKVLMDFGEVFLYLELFIMVLPVIILTLFPLFLLSKRLLKRILRKVD